MDVNVEDTENEPVEQLEVDSVFSGECEGGARGSGTIDGEGLNTPLYD